MTHAYLSTACAHGECGSCRNVCKFCPASCEHGCHPQADALPVSPVDQAREIAGQLLAAIRPEDVPPALADRIRDDPALFWLRGEVQTPGQWTPDPLEET